MKVQQGESVSVKILPGERCHRESKDEYEKATSKSVSNVP